MDLSKKQLTLSVNAINPARAVAFHAVLDCDGLPPAINSELPPFWHWIYFWDIPQAADIGEDGHRKPGGFIPDFGRCQRMWAAGSLEIIHPIIIGAGMTRVSTIEKLEEKQGKSGPLRLVTIRHDITQGQPAIVERQQLVYREAQRGAIPNQSFDLPANAVCQLEVEFNEVMLFQYSALTLNTHRIHYDADYCRDTAGYPALVVHGPLLATLLAQVTVAVSGMFKMFEYRAVAPAFCGQRVKFFAACKSDHVDLFACNEAGGICMQATASK